jgi:hypothetical protein
MTAVFRTRRRAKRSGDDLFRHDVALRLERWPDLFRPPALDEFGGSANLSSGVERLVADLVAARPAGHIHTTIEIPRTELSPEVEGRAKESIVRYCDARIREVEDRRTALRHEGLSALVLSAPLLALALLLTALVTHSGLPPFWRSFLGDGVLLILAWVALWYPLDTLLWYGRPMAREVHVLRAMCHMDVTVRAAD